MNTMLRTSRKSSPAVAVQHVFEKVHALKERRHTGHGASHGSVRGRAALALAALVLMMPVLPPAAAAGKPPGECSTASCSDALCARERTLCLLEKENAEKALDLLKNDRDEGMTYTEGKTFHLLMAKAYLTQDNPFWAVNTLSGYLARHPGDCEVKSWIAWVHLSTGDLDEAAHVLSDESCFEGDVKIASRFKMLETFLKIQQAENEGRDPKKIEEKKKKIRKIFPEDLDLYRYERSVLHPDYTMPLTIKAEAAGGYTTNALMGSPSDPTMSKKMYSPLAALDLWTRFVPPVSRWAAPAIELMAKGLYFFREEEGVESYPQQYSYMDAGVRPGVMFFLERYPRLLVAYKGNFLFINKPTKYQKDTPVFFYEGHRGEFELEANPHLTLFGGAGKRIFDETVRTRLEFDGGVGAGWTFLGRISLLGAVTMRYFRADEEAYNDFGVTGLLSATAIWHKGMKVKATAMLGMDNYMDSKGYFSEGKLRKDTMLKVAAQYITPGWKGLKGALVYEFSKKYSTIDAYAYRDVRAMVKLLWDYSFDLWKPRGKADPDHVPVDYGLEAGQIGEVSERIQDLLRQDESVRRGSSCKD